MFASSIRPVPSIRAFSRLLSDKMVANRQFLKETEAAKGVVGKDGAPIVDKRWGNLSTKMWTCGEVLRTSCAGGNHAGNGAVGIVNDIDRVKTYTASGFINVAGRNEFCAFCGI